MLKIIKDSTLVPTPIVDLKLDSEPRLGSTDPVTSEGVKNAIDGAVGDASEALQEQINEIAEKAGSGYIPKGEADVATLNGLSGQENGWLYTMTDAGTLTDGSLAVVAGDTVAWDESNSVWYKAMDYAPRQYGTNEVHKLPTTITAFRTGDVIAVDGPSGTAKMAKDDLLKETAENAIHSMYPASVLQFSTDVLRSSIELVATTFVDGIFDKSSDPAYKTSDFINVSNILGKVYLLVESSFTSYYEVVKFYDANQNEIGALKGGFAQNRIIEIVPSASCKYVRYARRTAYPNYGIFSLKNVDLDTQIEKKISEIDITDIPTFNFCTSVGNANLSLIATTFVDGIFDKSSDPTYKTSDYIDVTGNFKKLIFRSANVFTSYFSIIKLYDENQNEILDVKGGNNDFKNDLVEINIPHSCKYIRYAKVGTDSSAGLYIVGSSTFDEQVNDAIGASVTENTKFKAIPTFEFSADVLPSSLQMISTTFVDGIFEKDSSAANKTSDYIDVTGDFVSLIFRSSNVFVSYFSIIKFYDANQNEILDIKGGDNNFKNNFVKINIPINCKYIRYAKATIDSIAGLYKVTNATFNEQVAEIALPTKHTVLWLGTSIPAWGGQKQNSYANRACKALGYTIYNNAVGSSGLCLNTGVLGNGRDCKDLAESTAEKHARYDDHIGENPYITSDAINSYGYDKLIIPYIDGNIAECDVVVFDHGYNDRVQILAEFNDFDTANKSFMQDDASIDRSTYIGAFVFLCNKIWEVNPNIKIYISSYLENESGATTWKMGKVICDYLEKIAKYWDMPYLNMCDYNGMFCRLQKGTENYIQDYNTEYGTSYTIMNLYGESNPNNCCSRFQLMCPDQTHPHSDKTGLSSNVLTESMLHCLRDI